MYIYVYTQTEIQRDGGENHACDASSFSSIRETPHDCNFLLEEW